MKSNLLPTYTFPPVLSPAAAETCRFDASFYLPARAAYRTICSTLLKLAWRHAFFAARTRSGYLYRLFWFLVLCSFTHDARFAALPHLLLPKYTPQQHGYKQQTSASVGSGINAWIRTPQITVQKTSRRAGRKLHLAAPAWTAPTGMLKTRKQTLALRHTANYHIYTLAFLPHILPTTLI